MYIYILMVTLVVTNYNFFPQLFFLSYLRQNSSYLVLSLSSGMTHVIFLSLSPHPLSNFEFRLDTWSYTLFCPYSWSPEDLKPSQNRWRGVVMSETAGFCPPAYKWFSHLLNAVKYTSLGKPNRNYCQIYLNRRCVGCTSNNLQARFLYHNLLLISHTNVLRKMCKRKLQSRKIQGLFVKICEVLLQSNFSHAYIVSNWENVVMQFGIYIFSVCLATFFLKCSILDKFFLLERAHFQNVFGDESYNHSH